MVFPFRQIIIPIAPEESISETHQFWKESGSVEKFGRDSNISLSFANINAMHFFLGLRIFKTKRGKDINETLPFSSFQRIKPSNFQFCISKTTSARGCKLPKHEKFYHIPSLALFTAAVFIYRLLVNLRPASQEAVIGKNLTYFDLLGCLFVFFLG